MLLLLYPAWSGASVVETPKGAVIFGGSPRGSRRILHLREQPEEDDEKKPKRSTRDVIEEVTRRAKAAPVQEVASTPVEVEQLVGLKQDEAADLQLKRRRSAVLMLLLEG